MVDCFAGFRLCLSRRGLRADLCVQASEFGLLTYNMAFSLGSVLHGFMLCFEVPSLVAGRPWDFFAFAYEPCLDNAVYLNGYCPQISFIFYSA